MITCSNCRDKWSSLSWYGMPVCYDCFKQFQEKYILKKQEQQNLKSQVKLDKHARNQIRVRYCQRCQETFYTRYKRPKVCPSCYKILNKHGVNIIKVTK